MRCSSCEPLLDAYLERTLQPRKALRVAKHLRTCAACRALMAELRSVDGLLLGAKQPELPPNFTFAVIAEVRSRPVVRRRRLPAWAALASYVSLAWLAAAAFFLVRGGRLPQLADGFSKLEASGAWRAVAGALHAFGPVTPVAAAIVALVLVADVILFAALFAFYRAVRPRLGVRVAQADQP